MPRKKWIWSNKQHKLIPVEEIDRYNERVHYVMDDIKGYQSPSSLNWVEGRRQRRLDLKATGCREVDPSEKKEYFQGPAETPIHIDTDRLSYEYDRRHN